MELIRAFKDINKDDVILAGGKGASLGEMTQAGIPVPPGYVVLSAAFERFIEETDLNVEIDAALNQVNHKDVNSVEQASEKIRAMIISAKMPDDIAKEVKEYFTELNAEFVAVRSSATAEDSSSAAWAGQLDSFLNTTESTLLENLQKCWASLFTPRAIFYRFEKGLEKQKISVAVVVQKMVNSEVSGIAFSVHPVTQDYDQLIIEASFGLGEAIVSGQITPDSHVVDKKDWSITDTNVATKERGLFRKPDGGNEWKDILPTKSETRSLTDEQVTLLSKLIVDIEKHYGFPVDIEWAMENNKLYIVQSRPITTLSPQSDKPSLNIGTHDDYQKLFQVNAMPYLVSDMFMGHYRALNCMVFFYKHPWYSFMPKDVVERTHALGVELYGNDDEFKKYKENYAYYEENVIGLFNRLLAKDKISKQEIEEVVEKCSQNWFYYARTEFIYVDKAYQLSESNAVLKKNLEDFGKFKANGRLLLNKLYLGKECLLTRLLDKLSKQFSIETDVLYQYSKQELIDLFDNKTIDEQIIADRNKAYIMQTDTGKINYLAGDEAEAILEEFLNWIDKDVTTLKGTVANEGKAKGTAKLIPYGYDTFADFNKMMDEMKQGQILVTETTSPELMPAIKKAAAIVTNQGGLLSHAAVVSRELKIPCILDTNIATDVIKDGDMIEVDADNGTVRIIR
jgi:phosphoenolpyruvate synthase/pyruvate phosphate dikinase